MSQIVALSPDPSQISTNGEKRADEKSTAEDFFDKYADGILAQYTQTST